MEYRRLGNSGLQVSALSFGSWVTFGAQVNDDTAEKCMKTAYEKGVNFFDNAEVYASGKSELVMGALLKKFNWDRSSYLVSSKVFWGGNLPNQFGLSRKHIVEACDKSLKRLGLDYLDLYFCHRPDPNTPIEETVRAMAYLVDSGKILYWGTSEWSAVQIREAWTIAKQLNLTPPTMEQPEYNLLKRDKVEVEFLPLYSEMGLGTTIWSPLASGMLTGKYLQKNSAGTRLERKGMEWLKERILGHGSEQKHELVLKLLGIANQLGIPLSRLSISWVLKNKYVSTAILGASSTGQLEENLLAINDLDKLSPDVMREIHKIVSPETEATVQAK